MSPSGNDIHSDDLRPTSRPLSFLPFFFSFFHSLHIRRLSIFITTLRPPKCTYIHTGIYTCKDTAGRAGIYLFFSRRRWISLNYKWQRRNLLDTKVEMIVGGAGFGSMNSATHPHGWDAWVAWVASVSKCNGFQFEMIPTDHDDELSDVTSVDVPTAAIRPPLLFFFLTATVPKTPIWREVEN